MNVTNFSYVKMWFISFIVSTLFRGGKSAPSFNKIFNVTVIGLKDTQCTYTLEVSSSVTSKI